MPQDYHDSTAKGASAGQNKWVETTLRSPEHARVSHRIMLISFTGRKSGKQYTTPVSYMQEGATITCFTDSPWWRNLEGGVSVQVVLRGQEVSGTAFASREPAGVERGLRRLTAHDADDAKYFGVTVGPDGLPDEEQLQRAAAHNAMIIIKLDGV